jgi:hypothetical protein
MRSTAVFALLLGVFAAFAAAWSKEGAYICSIASSPITVPFLHPEPYMFPD